MDSAVEITLVGVGPDSAAAAFHAARVEIERLESLLSDYRPESNVSRLNRREIDVPAPETRFLLERAQAVCRATGGAFDPCLRRLKATWGFGSGRTPHLPDSAAVRASLPARICDAYTLEPDGRLAWHDSLAEIDLGGIAQGYVAGRVADLLQARGVARFLVDVSGDIVAAGERPGGGAWRVGLANPRAPDSLLGRLTLDARSVTTSGDYEQSFVASGKRYHHLFDPHTGWPEVGVASATIVADDPADADCYATALAVLGAERGLALLEARADLRGVIVAEAEPGRLVVLTSGVRIEPIPEDGR